MRKIKASFKQGKLLNIFLEIICFFIVLISISFLIFVIINFFTNKFSFIQVLVWLIIFIFLLIVFLIVLCKSLILKNNIKKWLQDAVEVVAFVKLTEIPGWSTPAELTATITIKHNKNKKEKIIMHSKIYRGKIYWKCVDKKNLALYSPKYNQLMFFE